MRFAGKHQPMQAMACHSVLQQSWSGLHQCMNKMSIVYQVQHVTSAVLYASCTCSSWSSMSFKGVLTLEGPQFCYTCNDCMHKLKQVLSELTEALSSCSAKMSRLPSPSTGVRSMECQLTSHSWLQTQPNSDNTRHQYKRPVCGQCLAKMCTEGHWNYPSLNVVSNITGKLLA